jgi:hypothetical protein
MFTEEFERRCRGDFEESDWLAGIDLFAKGKCSGEFGIADKLSAATMAKPDPLVKMQEMRRCIDVDAAPSRLKDRPHEGNGRALAIGASNMDDGRQPKLRMAERFKQSHDAAERKVDLLWVQIKQPAENGFPIVPAAR